MSASRVLAAASLLWGCGESASPFVNHVEDPQPQAGGGVGSGSIAGELHVFVVDDATGEALPGAEVRIGGHDAPEPLLATTDKAGHALFEDGSLEGPQVVTAIAEGYAVSTWFGVDGAVTTIPLEAADPPVIATEAPPTAMVTGTIVGWDDIPDPDPGYVLAALVTFSRTDPSEDLIVQDPHPLLSSNPFLGSLLPNLSANTCIRFPALGIDACDWSLRTRTGDQTLFALIALIGQNGDFQILGYASLAGLSPAEDDDLVENVTMVDESTLVDTTIATGALPKGLDTTAHGAIIDLGEPGWVVLPPPDLAALLPAVDLSEALLPEATGDFDGTYSFFAAAFEPGTTPYPVSRLADRDGEPGDVDLGEWLPPPAEPAGDPVARAYSFRRADATAVHDVSIDDTDGTRAYNVLVLEPVVEVDDPPQDAGADGGVPSDVITFTLPALAVDPLPLGNLHLTVRATEVVGFDPRAFTDLQTPLRTASRQSEDRLRISQ